MTSTQSLHITLPDNVATLVRAKVASGEYANESAVLHAGVNALLAKEQAVEHWLKTAVAASYDAMQTNPGQAIPIDEMQQRMALRRMGRNAKV